MNLRKKYTLPGLLLILIAGIGLSSCKKDYYLDSGLANPYFDGTVVDYFNAQPFYFDSVAAVVKLAGMEDVFTQDTITFFSPTDYSIQNLINGTNSYLYQSGFDTIRTLQDVPPAIWRKYLTLYLFHGANQLKDYPQIDYDLLVNFPGQTYYTWDNQPMNIGVVYGSDNGVKYVGYRQLSISYIPNAATPMANWNTAMVASCNILTKNGVVHVLTSGHSTFGFDLGKFANDVQAAFANSGK